MAGHPRSQGPECSEPQAVTLSIRSPGRKRLLLGLQDQGLQGPVKSTLRDEWQAGSVPREVGESPLEWALAS